MKERKMSDCKSPVIDGNKFNFCFSSNENPYQRLADLQKEIAELKKQLNKKTAPPKGTLVMDMDSKIIGYSVARLDNDGWLFVTDRPDDDNPDNAMKFWKEIEIKVKE
jgi:hypothetical protein